MTPAEAVRHLKALALKMSGLDGEAIAIAIDHIGSLERAVTLIRASHENFVRHLPENAVHEVNPRKKVKS